MRVLHTADLHLGRQFNGIPLDDDHAAVLDQVLRAVVDLRADVLVIAGDIFDRAAPPETAVRQFNAFLARFASETEAAFVMIAGNHDSGHRIAAMSIMPDTRRVLIRGAVSPDEKPLLLSDEHGTVAFSGLPFAYEYAARECFADEKMQTPEDVLRAQVAAARCNIPSGARWVIVAHAFVSGARGSDSERPLARVGGIDTVPPEIFTDAHYVALGHPDRTDTQRHQVVTGLSLRNVMERLLIPMRIMSSRDSQQITGLLLQLSRALESDPDEQCTVYRMSPATGRARGVDVNGEVTNLFQGQAPVFPPARRGEVYPGDRAIREDGRVSIQIHTLDLTRDGNVVRENVPVLAVWVPARLAVGWINQNQPGQNA